MRTLGLIVALNLKILGNSADSTGAQLQTDGTLHHEPVATSKRPSRRDPGVLSPSLEDHLKSESTALSEQSQGVYEEWNMPAVFNAVEELPGGATGSPRRRGVEIEEREQIVGGMIGHPEVHGCRDYSSVVRETRQLCGPPLTLPCFDHSRCLRPPQGTGPSIYVYDDNCSLANSDQLHHRDASHWSDAVSQVGLLAESYESACLFIQVNSHAHEEPCAPQTPLWNGGANHMMIDFTSWGRDFWPHISNSYAMEGAANMPTCYYRSGFDIAMPLRSKKTFPMLSAIAPWNREFFLTVKASVYLSGHGAEERMSALHLHNEANGVIVAMKCFDSHGEPLVPGNEEYCREHQARYDAFDYQDLMNTTFGLVPGGRSPATFRLGEVMSAGAIPVFIVRDWVRPFTEQIDWPAFSFIFSPDQVGPEMMRILQSVSPEMLKNMQRKSLKAYRAIFGGTTDYARIARDTVAILLRRIDGHR